MNGYLQCLIDQYVTKANKALDPEKRNIYREVLNDLLKFKEYVEMPQETSTDDVPKKHIALDFVGTMPGLMEYLKNLSLREGGIK
ncbi:hypothetical protein [Clostridium sp. AWRP]|uniref:hypothetical protein n=1 Tax=Clostridium sp. AWRP TaxID=2212991 RepID=UPI000FD720AA|nr:hypothetical protein [Clostridium sp. AWRP]AZV56048.1 hypothetical protein DMR38_05235 [Clostridium sp. AWRP]